MTREEAIMHIDGMINTSIIVRGIVPDEYDIEALRTAIEALSTEAVQGEWIDRSDGGRIKYPWWESCECNQCGEYGSGAYNYCPSCGARMEANE